MDSYEYLVDQARSADEARRRDVFGELARRFEGPALKWAYAALGDFQLAQDAVQESFLTAYERIDQLREPRAFPAWLRRIVHSQCNRMTRGKRVPIEPLRDQDIPAAGGDPAASAEDGDLRDRLLEAVRDLPEHDREVIELYYMTGYAQDEIAGMLGLPLTTVKKRLQYARERLKEALPEAARCALDWAGCLDLSDLAAPGGEDNLLPIGRAFAAPAFLDAYAVLAVPAPEETDSVYEFAPATWRLTR